MDVKDNVHDIFLVDPIEQAESLKKKVKIIVTNGETIIGMICAIDPVSQSIVVSSRKYDSDVVSLKIVMKHSIKSMEFLPAEPKDFQLLDAFLPCESLAETSHLKSDVKIWLEKNMIPVNECGEVLKVDNVEIHPPYGPNQCYSSNEIVLARIQNLLEKRPASTVQH